MDTLAASGRWGEQGFGFGVVVELFDSRLEEAEQAEHDRFLAQVASEAVPIFTPGERELEPTFDVLHGLYRICAVLSEKRPLALLVDDIDLVDEPSLRFLRYLIERLGERRIAVILASGSIAHRLAHPEVDELTWHPGTVRIELAPFTERETADRVRTVWSEATDEDCRALLEEAAGNPFLVELLTAERRSPGGDATPSIAAWARRRAARLHRAAPALLTAVAVLGPACELRHAAAIAGWDSDIAADVADLLAEVGLVKQEDGLSFQQPAVAHAVAACQDSGERAAAHLAAARLLGSELAPPEAVAEHLLEAPRRGSNWAVQWLCQAAAIALSRGFPRDAVVYLRRALAEPPMGRQRSHVVLELGRAEAIAGEPQAAVRLSEAAGWESVAGEEPGQALPAARALFVLGRTDEAMAVFERALQDKGKLDRELAGRLEAGHAAARWLLELREGSVIAEPPPESADTPGNRSLLALHAMDRAIRGTDCTEVRDLAEQALARGALLADETADGFIYYMAVGALVIAEELQTAEASLTAAVEEAQARGSVLGFATASHVRAMAILMRGRVLDAATDAQNALDAGPKGWRLGPGGARIVLAFSALETGDVIMAERHLADAEATMGEDHPLRLPLLLGRGAVALARGEPASALEHLLTCGELAAEAGHVNPAVAPWRALAARAYAEIGDRTEGTGLAEEALGRAQTFGAPAPIGRALRALAVNADPERELEALEEAVTVLRESQVLLERTRALIDFGAALRRSGRPRDARDPLREGLELAEACGARALAERAMTETIAAGARPRRTALTGPDSLTTRERQVATLAAEGLSNREIAKRLVVTVKTVEFHLKHSYRKLGVGSRHSLREVLSHGS
jgi:DNA-binding CsgD family transcriptional regulator